MAHPYYEKHALLFLFEEKRKPPVGNFLKKMGQASRLLRGVIGGGECRPLIATKAYQSIHLERLAVPVPKGCRETALPTGCNPERAIASVNRCPLLSHIRLLTHLFSKGSVKTKRLRQSLPKL